MLLHNIYVATFDILCFSCWDDSCQRVSILFPKQFFHNKLLKGSFLIVFLFNSVCKACCTLHSPF